MTGVHASSAPKFAAWVTVGATAWTFRIIPLK